MGCKESTEIKTSKNLFELKRYIGTDGTEMKTSKNLSEIEDLVGYTLHLKQDFHPWYLEVWMSDTTQKWIWLEHLGEGLIFLSDVKIYPK